MQFIVESDKIIKYYAYLLENYNNKTITVYVQNFYTLIGLTKTQQYFLVIFYEKVQTMVWHHTTQTSADIISK